MGFVKDELAEPNQIVKGVIIGLEDDLRIRRALSVTNNIEYYRYEVSFKLNKQWKKFGTEFTLSGTLHKGQIS